VPFDAELFGTSLAGLVRMTQSTTEGGNSNSAANENARIQDMVSEGGAVDPPETPVANESKFDGAESDLQDPAPRSFTSWLEDLSHKWGDDHLRTLARKKGRLSTTMENVPENMHRMANQTQLILELIDDFRDGTYRKISWRSVALLVGGLLYTVSPADVVPDVVPFLGKLDDLAVLALITRLVNRDLREYCAFKGYLLDDYFRPRASS